MKTEIITSLKELSKIIDENKEELYNIDARGIVLDKIERIGVPVRQSADTAIGSEYQFFNSVRNLLNSLIHDLILNNQNPDIGLKMCSDIGLILAIYDE